MTFCPPEAELFLEGDLTPGIITYMIAKGELRKEKHHQPAHKVGGKEEFHHIHGNLPADGGVHEIGDVSETENPRR
jgi:hypothetical protein